MKTHRGTISSASAALLLMAACAAPRLPPVTAPGFAMDRDEALLWKEAEELEARARRSGALDEDAALERYLAGVARKLLPRPALQRLHVRVRVVDDPHLNAFALPDGGLFVNTGMLARLENEAQLATLLGHEIVHAVNRHAVVEYRTFKNSAAVSAALPVPFGLGYLGVKASVTGYSRDLEREADEQGLALVAAAGYDVSEAPRVFEHLAAWLEEEKIDEPFFFGDHPRVQERAKSFRRLLETEYAGRRGQVGADRYGAAIREVLLRDARLDLAAGRFGGAERSARRYLDMRPRSAEAWAVLGDASRQANAKAGPQRALDHYRKAISLDPACGDAHRGLGLVLLKLGDAEGARSELRRYLKLRPNAEDRAFVAADLAVLDGRTP